MDSRGKQLTERCYQLETKKIAELKGNHYLSRRAKERNVKWGSKKLVCSIKEKTYLSYFRLNEYAYCN